MKKIKNLAFSIIGVGLLTGCAVKPFDPTNSDAPPVEEPTIHEVLDVSIIGGISALDSFSTPLLKMTQGSDSSDSLTAEKETILNNLKIAQSMIDGSLITSEVKDSTKEGFEKEYTIKTKDITGEEKIYTFFYSETIKENHDKDEQEWSLNGIVVLDDVEYQVSGEKEIETGEEEIEFVVKIDQNNYVIVENEFENNETEYAYTIIENGREVFETSIGYEVNKNGHIELEFETEIEGKEEEFEFIFYEENKEKYVKVKFESDGNKDARYLIKIIVEGETIRYEFI